jgi:ATP-dependent Clp protease ATP-binding subunit ClpX
VEKAIEFQLGARGLRSILEAILIDAMFELPANKKTKKLQITLDYASSKLSKASLAKLKAAV